MTTIFEIPEILVVWLMSYLIVISSALVNKILTVLNKRVKRNMINKHINNSRLRRKLNIQKVKCWQDFIELIVHIDDGSFDFCLLERSKGI